ncbi:hypothetical protein AAES_22722 [Amazona aestiva]|uniref:Uncharacterized protein n=1 Tax=Amazona aestiva TaxID=12930 RepID=A0A0Q3X7M8_AMAAE|nr:hypothetical protein AAES_22722 [Amazona aestiva]
MVNWAEKPMRKDKDHGRKASVKFCVKLAHEVQLQFRATTSDNLQVRRSTAFDPVQLEDELEQQNPQCQTEEDVIMWAGRF